MNNQITCPSKTTKPTKTKRKWNVKIQGRTIVSIVVKIVQLLTIIILNAIFFYALDCFVPLRDVLPNFYKFVDGILYLFNSLCLLFLH